MAGKAIGGATVTLLERPALQAVWEAAGTATSSPQGNVSVSVPALTTNAVFRLTGPHGARSAIIRITVSPPIATTLVPGTGGVHDALVVSTQYARPGNLVVLQLQSSGGGWVSLRERALTANGTTRFVLNAAKLANQVVRVVLLPTVRHALSVSSPVTVPPPS